MSQRLWLVLRPRMTMMAVPDDDGADGLYSCQVLRPIVIRALVSSFVSELLLCSPPARVVVMGPAGSPPLPELVRKGSSLALEVVLTWC